MPLLSSPAFLMPPVPSPQNPNSNPTQLHALGLATFAGELLEMYEQVQLCIEGDMRADGLRVVRDSLVSIVKRVVEPLVTAIKNDLVPHIDALENPSATPIVVVQPAGTKPAATPKTAAQHPSIAHMQSVMPTYTRALSRYITSTTAEATLASLLLSLVWRGLVALSNRPIPAPTPNSSPRLQATAFKKEGKTPPTTPPPSKFALRLPPSRPPSPSGGATVRPSAAADAKALCDLLSSLPRPKGEAEQKRLAEEVAEEAFEALAAFPALLESVQAHGSAIAPKFRVADPNDLEHELEILTADIPTLIALPIVLRTYFPVERPVAAMLGLTEPAYRNGCLAGFVRADECTVAVGQHMSSVLREEARGLGMDESAAREAGVVLKWLEREVALAAVGDSPGEH